MEEVDNTELRKEMSELPMTLNASSSKYTGLGATMAAELNDWFWFGIGIVFLLW